MGGAGSRSFRHRLFLSAYLALATLWSLQAAMAAFTSRGVAKDAWPEYQYMMGDEVRVHLADENATVWSPESGMTAVSVNPYEHDDKVWLYTDSNGFIYQIPARGQWHPNRVNPGWPELLGVDYQEAIDTILTEVVGIEVVYGPAGFLRIEDLRNNRVFLDVDKKARVAQVPRIG